MATKMFTYNHTCRECGEETTFEYSEGPYFGNGWDETDEGASDFAIQGARGCLNAASVADEVCDEDDICTLTDEQLTDAAHEGLCITASEERSERRRYR
jgi:hypothetical protein